MKKRTKILTVCFSLVMLISAVGCVAVSKVATLSKLDPMAVDYVVSSGIADANDFKPALYPNLAMAEDLARKVEIAHTINQNAYQQLIETDNLDYGIAKDVAMFNVEQSRKLEEQLFGETGLVSIGLTAMGVAPLAGLVGLLRKRPQDFTPEDVAKIRDELDEAGIVSSRAFDETVAAIEKFKTVATPENWAMLKAALNAQQSSDTKAMVAQSKLA